MANDLNCPNTARDYEQLLNVMEFHQVALTDPDVMEARQKRNCSAYDDKFASLCRHREGNLTHYHITSLEVRAQIDHCYQEQRSRNRTLTAR